MALDIWTIAVGAFILLIGFWGWKIVQDRMEVLHYEEELANQEFENQFLQQEASLQRSESATPTGHKPLFTDPAAAVVTHTSSAGTDESMQTQSAVTAAEDKSRSLSISAAHLPADERAHDVIKKMNAISLLESINGYFELHGNPKGVAILQLRNRKTALLVPHMESEAFLRRNSKRADMIIMVGTDGKAVVVRPLEDLIADSIGL